MKKTNRWATRWNLSSVADAAGCRIIEGPLGTTHVMVGVPGFFEHGMSIDMTSQVRAYAGTGEPTTWEIINAAVTLAEAANFGNAWKEIRGKYPPEVIRRRQQKAMRRRLIARGWRD